MENMHTSIRVQGVNHLSPINYRLAIQKKKPRPYCDCTISKLEYLRCTYKPFISLNFPCGIIGFVSLYILWFAG